MIWVGKEERFNLHPSTLGLPTVDGLGQNPMIGAYRTRLELSLIDKDVVQIRLEPTAAKKMPASDFEPLIQSVTPARIPESEDKILEPVDDAACPRPTPGQDFPKCVVLGAIPEASLVHHLHDGLREFDGQIRHG